MTAIHPKRPAVFMDEASSFFFDIHGNDALKESLRQIEGVPYVVYQVRDGRVFVFNKLLQLVKAHQSEHRGEPLAAWVPSLIDQAAMTAIDAVQTWGIVPEPYELGDAPSGGFMIHHRPFNARLPGTFSELHAAQKVLARLLLGEHAPGNGDFSYLGQRMTLCAPLDPVLLPPRPAFPHAGGGAGFGYAALRTVSYQPGFEPLTEALFCEVKRLEAEWKDDSGHAAQHAQREAAAVWAQAASFGVDGLNELDAGLPEHGQQACAGLRHLYPELGMLSDAALYAWFDKYQVECCYVDGWCANRDDDFLFYLLGKVVGRDHEQEAAIAVGQWAASALLRGASAGDARAMGRTAAAYDRAVANLAGRVAEAMRYLSDAAKTSVQQGRSITTVMDTFRNMRKVNSRLLPVEQRLADLVSAPRR